MSPNLSISRDQSAQVSVYFEIPTCLQLMNMSQIVLLYLASIFISGSFVKNSYEESKPGNEKPKREVQLEESKPRKNVNIRIAISTWLGTPFNKLIWRLTRNPTKFKPESGPLANIFNLPARNVWRINENAQRDHYITHKLLF